MIGHRAGPGRPLRATAAAVVAIALAALLVVAGCSGSVTRLATPDAPSHDSGQHADLSWLHGRTPGSRRLERPAFCRTAEDLRTASRMVEGGSVAKAKRSVSLLYAMVRKADDQAPEEIAGALHTIRAAYADFNDAVQHAETEADVTDAGSVLEDHRGFVAAGKEVGRYIDDHCSSTTDG